jgi:hypothetical protein
MMTPALLALLAATATAQSAGKVQLNVFTEWMWYAPAIFFSLSLFRQLGTRARSAY